MPKRKSVALTNTITDEQARSLLIGAQKRYPCSMAIHKMTQVVETLAKAGGTPGTIARILLNTYSVRTHDESVRKHINRVCDCYKARA
jgi:hypothetical protein